MGRSQNYANMGTGEGNQGWRVGRGVPPYWGRVWRGVDVSPHAMLLTLSNSYFHFSAHNFLHA